MSVIGIREVIKMIKDGVDLSLGTFKSKSVKNVKPLIENFDKDAIVKPEGTTFDVRLDKLFELKNVDNLGNTYTPELLVSGRITANSTEISPDGKQIYSIYPNKPYLVTTLERLNTPNNIFPMCNRRTTMFRSGLIMQMTNVSPGYRGYLSFMIYNVLNHIVRIQRGFGIASIAFFTIDGRAVPYDGVWQENKRITTTEEIRPK